MRGLAASGGLVGAALLGACRAAPLDEEAARVPLVVEGNTALSKKTLRQELAYELGELSRSGFDRALADDTAFQASVIYAERGYASAEVDFRLEGTDAGGKRLVLIVEEGPRTVLALDRMGLDGVEAFTRDEVRALFAGPQTGIFGTGDLLFVERLVGDVPDRLLREYVARGWIDAEVDPVAIELSEDRQRAIPTVTAREGTRYRVGAVVFRGEAPRALPGEEPYDWERVFRRLTTESGKERVFHPRVPWEVRGDVLEELFARGHADAEVDVEARKDPEDGLVHLEVAVDPGPRVVVAALAYEGRRRTRPSFLQSRISLEEGEPWRIENERESLRRLYETGLFHRVDLDLRPLPDSPEEGEGSAETVERELLVDVTEAPSRELWVEPGYGSYERLRLRVGATEKNLFGTGRRLRVEGTVADKALRARAGLTNPWFLRTDLVADLLLGFEERENPSFTERKIGTGFFVTKEWTPVHATTLGYQYQRSEILDFQDITGEVMEALEDVDLSSVRASHRFDSRQPVFLPESGLFSETVLEWGDEAIGSELNFVRTTAWFSGYWALRRGTVLASSLRGGIIWPVSGEDTIPVQERFFNGGENQVRSFREDELGPKDASGDPVGGESYKTWSLELRQRLGETRFEVATFYDVGDVHSQASDWAKLDALESGIGVGLRYQLPVGPLRVDAAWNPDPGPGEDDYVVHFALGIAF